MARWANSSAWLQSCQQTESLIWTLYFGNKLRCIRVHQTKMRSEHPLLQACIDQQVRKCFTLIRNTQMTFGQKKCNPNTVLCTTKPEAYWWWASTIHERQEGHLQKLRTSLGLQAFRPTHITLPDWRCQRLPCCLGSALWAFQSVTSRTKRSNCEKAFTILSQMQNTLSELAWWSQTP